MAFEDDLLALERRVLEEAGGDFFRAIAALRHALAGQKGGLAAAVERLAIPQLEQAAKDGALEAYRMGGARALDGAYVAPHVDANAASDAALRLDQGPPRHLVDPLEGLDARLIDARTRSLALFRTGAPADVALAPILGAANTAKLRTTTQINAASNEAALQVGDAAGSPMVWEAERDACVYCLALSGHVIETPGDVFPPADLYADPPASQWTVTRPPLHGHCRCRLTVLVDRSYAEALQREAQRSVLRGHSLASESQAVRIRAAQRLLERDPIAPKSVKAYAAKAVKAGHFPMGADVPKGDPRLSLD